MQHLEGLLSTEAPTRGQTTSVVEACTTSRSGRTAVAWWWYSSDMLDSADREDEVFDALQHLRFNKHDMILFHVVDRKHELELGSSGPAVHLRGCGNR